MQQSKARKKDDWQVAFSPVIVDGVITTIRGAPHEIQEKVRRLVEVWSQRTVFDSSVLSQIGDGIDLADKNKKRPLMGGSLFSGGSGGGVPTELQMLAQLHGDLTKTSIARSSVGSTHQETKQLIDKSVPKPPAPKYSAQLSSLLKNLHTAESAVQAGLTARRGIIEELQRLLEAQNQKVINDQTTLVSLQESRAEAEQIRRDVEDRILRGLEDETAGVEPARPEMEPLTPPMKPCNGAADSTTPPGSPPPKLSASIGFPGLGAPAHSPTASLAAIPSDPRLAKRPLEGLNGTATKKRKVGDEDEGFLGMGDALDGIDPDVQAMLG